uniref:S ribonuclease n=1 Tax=Haemonchus contortus TaxID=6289 RepID=A0A7I4YB36_HAECO
MVGQVYGPVGDERADDSEVCGLSEMTEVTMQDRAKTTKKRRNRRIGLYQTEDERERLRCYGHVLRRPQNHPIRQAMEFEAPARRPRRPPQKRWRDVIKMDLAESNGRRCHRQKEVETADMNSGPCDCA